ncbi:MATH domain-containing protein-like isoform X1 [Iris pallida]|nr:MATH domain-containing protein-like isoform X1 [Iris pallida]
MSRDKIGSILKLVVKHFFIEKEVISTLVMDSLYSGLRALECQSSKNKGRENILEMEELPSPMVGIEEDMFVLADDVFLLLERAISETLPHQPVPPKDDKYSHNRAKEGTSGDEFTRDSIVRDERRLTELGRRTLEIFVLAHIFSSRIEVAYQEAVALKRQEELIREEEEAGQAESELKAKRRALEKEKRAKKKQAKQRKRNGKGKDKGKDGKLDGVTNGNDQQGDSLDGRDLDNSSPKEAEKLHNNDIRGDVSDMSELGDDGSEVLQPDEEDRYSSPHSWETDTLEIHPTKAHISEMEKEHVEKKSTLSMDDSSSTCSTDSVLSVVLNGPCQGNSSSNIKINGTSNRGKKQRNKDRKTCSIVDAGQILHATGICRGTEPESDGKIHPLKDRVLSLEQHQDLKVEVAVSLEKKSIDRDEVIVVTPPEPRTIESSSSSNSPSRKPLSLKQLRKTTSATAIELPVSTCKQTSNTPAQTVQSAPLLRRLSQTPSVLKSEVPKPATEPITTRDHQKSSISRPSSAPLISGPRPAASPAPTKQALPPLSCTLNSVCHLVNDPSPSDQCYEPQSYRNAIMGIKVAKGPSSSGFTPRPSLTPSSQSIMLSQPLSSFPSSSSTQTPMMDVKKELSVDPGFSSDLHNPASFCSYQEADQSQHVINRNDTRTGCNIQSRPSQGAMPDEFPHLDIINDLLDEEQIAGRTTGYHHRHDHHPLDRQYTIPGDSASSSLRNGSFGYDLFEPCYDAISQMVCDSSGVPYHLLGDPLPWSVDFLAYGSSQMGPLLQNQWPIGGADMSMMSFAGNAMNADGYAYHYPDFSTCLGGYNMMYQPANGL